MTTEFKPDGRIERRSPPAFTPPRQNWLMICTVAAIAALVGFGLLSGLRGTSTTSSGQVGGITTGISPTAAPAAPASLPPREGGSTR